MQKSKSIRVTNRAERELRKFIRLSPKKIYKIQFATEAIFEKIEKEKPTTTAQ